MNSAARPSQPVFEPARNAFEQLLSAFQARAARIWLALSWFTAALAIRAAISWWDCFIVSIPPGEIALGAIRGASISLWNRSCRRPRASISRSNRSCRRPRASIPRRNSSWRSPRASILRSKSSTTQDSRTLAGYCRGLDTTVTTVCREPDRRPLPPKPLQ